MAVDVIERVIRVAKLGGQDVIRVFLKGGEDLARSLLEPVAGQPRLRRDLEDSVREKFQRTTTLRFRYESGGRSDQLVQELNEFASVPQMNGVAGRQLERTRLWDEPADVVVFSLQSEVCPQHWRNEQRLVDAAPSRLISSPADALSAAEFKANFTRLIKAAKERLDAHVLVFNCSTIDPNAQVHNYFGREDDLALRIHKLNFALIELSIQEGISIIDVDRQIAELGGQRHVIGPCCYSDEACAALGQEVVRVLADIGFFENRPLVGQIGKGGK
jgi:hypothetical protein